MISIITLKNLGYLRSVLESRGEKLLLVGVKEDFDEIVCGDIVGHWRHRIQY